MELPSTVDELEALIEDLRREIDDHPLMPEQQRQAIAVQLLKARSRLAEAEPRPDPEPQQQPGLRDEKVRAWALAAGYALPSTGELPAALYGAYNATHPRQ